MLCRAPAGFWAKACDKTQCCLPLGTCLSLPNPCDNCILSGSNWDFLTSRPRGGECTWQYDTIPEVIAPCVSCNLSERLSVREEREAKDLL